MYFLSDELEAYEKNVNYYETYFNCWKLFLKSILYTEAESLDDYGYADWKVIKYKDTFLYVMITKKGLYYILESDELIHKNDMSSSNFKIWKKPYVTGGFEKVDLKGRYTQMLNSKFLKENYGLSTEEFSWWMSNLYKNNLYA